MASSRRTGSAPVSAPSATRSADRPAFVLALGVFFVLAVVLPLLVVEFDGVTQHLPAFQMATVVTVYAAFSVARICYNGAGKIVRLAYFIFVYAFLGLPVMAQLSANSFPLMFPTTGGYTSAETTRAYLVVFVGVVAFEVAAHLAPAIQSRRAAKKQASSPAPRWRIAETRILVLGGIGLVMAGIIVAKSGLQPFFDSRQAAKNAIAGLEATAKTFANPNKVMTVLLGHASKVPLLISLFGVLYLKRYGQWRPRTKLHSAFSHVMIILLVLANVVVNDPIANSRFWMCTVVITIVSVYLPLNRTRAIRWAAIASVVVLLFGFTTLETFRRVGGPQDHRVGFREDLTSSGSYAEFQLELSAVRWLETHEHTNGEQFLGSVGSFVPRSEWPGKPTDTGNLVLPYNNPAATLWTEGDVDLGILGTIIYMALLGAGAALADNRFRRAPPGSFSHAFTPIAAGFVVYLLRGSLQPVVVPTYFLIASILLLRKRTASGQVDG